MHFKTLIFSTLAACSLAAAASGTDRTFVASEADWSDAGNWTPNGVPADGDKAIIPDGGICHVDINNGRADSFEVQSGGQLIIDSGMLLEIDTNSSVADLDGVQFAGSGSVLKISESLTLSGAGSFEGQNDAARIEVAAAKTLTLASGTTIEGQMQIKGLSAIGGNGGFVNNGTVEANVGSATLLVHVDTVLQAGTGMFRVATSGAKLQFDAGTARDTEAGDVFVSNGTIYFAVDCCFDDFEWDGGVIDGVDGERFWYDSYNPGSAKSNPFDGTDGNYQYVDQYPNS